MRMRSYLQLREDLGRIARPPANTGGVLASTDSSAKSPAYVRPGDHARSASSSPSRKVIDGRSGSSSPHARRRSRAPYRNCPRPASQPRFAIRLLHRLEFLPRRHARALRSASPTACRPRRSAGCKPTQPRLQAFQLAAARIASPMTSSVLPPPMSTTRRLPGSWRHGVATPGIDQARFLEARDDLDRMAQRLARAFQEPSLAPRAAQRIGADDADAVGVHVAQVAGRSAPGRRARARRRPRRAGHPSSSPAASRTISRSRSMMTSCPCVYRATTM